MARALVGLGSNLGDRLASLRSAAGALRATAGIEPLAASSVWLSPPMGPVAQGEFLNAVVLIETELTPRALLARLLEIEAAHGRERRARWGPRTVDLDLLWLSGVTIDEPGLTVPHPGLATRAFVLRPAAELAPDLTLPDGRTLAAAAEESDDACVRVAGADLGW